MNESYFYDSEDNPRIRYYNQQKNIERALNSMPKVYLINEIKENDEFRCYFLRFLNCYLEFNFGKYKGTQVKNVLENDAPYLYWCMVNVDYFMMSYNDFDILNNKLKIDFKFSKDKLEKLKDIYNGKGEEIVIELDNLGCIKYCRDNDDPCHDDENELNRYDRKTYDRYGGPSFGGEILSDNFIDDVLDGNPDAYWNID